MTGVSSKAALNILPAPVSLTLAQFGTAVVWASIFSLFPISQSFLDSESHSAAAIWRTAAPISIFQVTGHVFSSVAVEKLSVSTVHTVKALSPLFTVVADRLLFGSKYSNLAYISLFPLTAGVIAACASDFSSHPLGLLHATLSTIVFVAQNLFVKKLFSSESKFGRLTLIYYSSAISFAITLPFWLYYDVFNPFHSVSIDSSITYLFTAYSFNGFCHFTQYFLALALLGITSPVSYSIASLIKRIFVIIVSILWFGQQTRPVQAVGILSTFFGLYLWDRAKLGSKSQSELLPLSQTSTSNL